MSLNIFKILYIAYLWWTKRAKLVGGRIAAAADKICDIYIIIGECEHNITVIIVALVISLS